MLQPRRSFLFLFSCVMVLACMARVRAQAAPQGSAVGRMVGVVRDSSGKPVADAKVSMAEESRADAQFATSDHDGNFAVTFNAPGKYVLRIQKEGFAVVTRVVTVPPLVPTPLSILLIGRDTSAPTKTLPDNDLQFADKPDFTVAGITDWTAAGGHGSDVNLRASEALARDTRKLSLATPSAVMRGRARERELRAAVLKDPDSFEANHALGEFCLKQRQFVDAIPSLEKAHQLNAKDLNNSYELAQAYDRAGRYAEAKMLVSQLLPQSDRPELHRLQGDIEEQLNNPLASEREYERAVQMQPSEENYFSWGGELLVHRAVEAAIDVFTKGAKAFPDSERMLAGLGAALYAHGSYEEGAKRVCDASDLNPSDQEPYLFLGKMEQASPRPLPCAKEKLARFARERSNDPWANYYYAISLLKPDDSAQSKDAEQLLENAVRLDPKFALAHLQLGVLKSNGGDWRGAREAYENAAASDPMLPDPHFRLAQVYKRLGDQEKASQELHTFENLKKSDAAAVEQRRREIRQFVVVMKDAPAAPPN